MLWQTQAVGRGHAGGDKGGEAWDVPPELGGEAGEAPLGNNGSMNGEIY